MDMKRMMLAVMATAVATWSFGDTQTVNGVEWTYRVERGNAVVCDMSGRVSGAITIPSTLGGFPVKEIAEDAFFNSYDLLSVVIPVGVTQIGNYAFYGCNLSGGVSLPEGLLTIGAYAFEHSGLTEIYIPSSVTHIYRAAFWSAEEVLASVTLCEGLKHIGEHAFQGSVFSSITIPASVERIGSGAVRRCESLARVTFLGNRSDVVVECSAFKGSPYDDALSFGFEMKDGVLTGYHGKFSGTTLTIPAGATEIGRNAFYGLDKVQRVVLPDGLKAIGDNAFEGCESLSEINLPTSLEKIGYEVFAGCSLAALDLPEGLKTMGEYMFLNCKSVPAMRIPESVRTISNATFAGVDGPVSISAPRSLASALYSDEIKFYGFCDIEFIPEADDWEYRFYTPTEAEIAEHGGPDAVTVTQLSVEYYGAKAQTVNCALHDKNGALVGTVQVKFGKPGKKGVKVTASATILQDGKSKKIGAKAATMKTGDNAVSVAFKDPIGKMELVMLGDGSFTLKNSSYVMAEGDVGGNWTRKDSKVYVDMTGSALPAGTLTALLPDGEPVIETGGKWAFNKAASVKWAKPKKGAEPPEIYDEVSGKGLIVDDTNGKTNLSGLKLTYTPKTGLFKGSFKVYALEGEGTKTKLKKYTVNVIGFVVDGVGYGEASIKKPAAGPWTVRVE